MKDNKIKRIIIEDDGFVLSVVSISDLINTCNDYLLDTIKSIWAVDSNLHNHDTDVDDFYL